MCRGAGVPFSVHLVVVVMVVVDVGSSLAAPPLPNDLTQNEVLMSIIINQMAILKGMNESTSFLTPNELNQLREEMENERQALNETVAEGMKVITEMVMEGMRAINETFEEGMNAMNETFEEGMKAMDETVLEGMKEINETMEEGTRVINETVEEGMKDMTEMTNTILMVNETFQKEVNALKKKLDHEIRRQNDTKDSRAREMNEMNNRINAMDDDVNRKIKELNELMNNKTYIVKDNVRRWMDEMNNNRTTDTQRVMEKLEAVQNTSTVHQRPDHRALYLLHNDTQISLCDGHKVLYGGRGYLAINNYKNNVDCSWEVTLPEGTRPVFRWKYFDMDNCTLCTRCDFVGVKNPCHSKYYVFCGHNAPDASFLTVMNNKFKVVFHSDGSKTGRGFSLRYRAVPRI